MRQTAILEVLLDATDIHSLRKGERLTLTLTDGNVVVLGVNATKRVPRTGVNGNEPGHVVPEPEPATRKKARLNPKFARDLPDAKRRELAAKAFKDGTHHGLARIATAAGLRRQFLRQIVQRFYPKFRLKYPCLDCRPHKMFLKPGDYARHLAHNPHGKSAKGTK